jgi:hypothetical protein
MLWVWLACVLAIAGQFVDISQDMQGQLWDKLGSSGTKGHGK